MGTDERGQTMVLSAVMLAVMAVLLSLLVVNLGWYAREMTALRNAFRVAAEDGALQVEALPAGADVSVAAARARAAALEVARANLAARGYDPALLDGADAPGCESGSGPCVYVETRTGCGLSDPLGAPGAFCGPFVSLRARVPVKALLGGYAIAPTFRAVAEVGRRPAGGSSPAPTPTPTPPAPPVVPDR